MSCGTQSKDSPCPSRLTPRPLYIKDYAVSFSYILSAKCLLLFFGALHAKDSGPSCPTMMHHHQTNIFLECVGCLRTNVPESIIQLSERQYLLT